MSNQLQIFNNPAFGEVRTTTVNDQPYFVGKDVATILGYSNPRDAIAKHIDDEDKGVAKCDTLGGTQELTVINESGLYSLILSSKMPDAKKFRRWVTSDVLPSLRKHGLYAADELLNNPDLMIKAMEALKEERAKNRVLESQIQQDKPKVLFADCVTASHTSILVFDLAKLLRQNGIKISGNRLFEWLRENGYLIKRKGADWNMPTQRSMESGLFEIKETTIAHADGHTSISKTPKVTGKGQVYFVNKFLSEKAS
jgi:anti-repressor protein